MEYPTEAQLRKWWEDQQKFFETPIGRNFVQLMSQVNHMQREHEVYKRTILDDVALRPLPPIFKEMK